MTTYPNGIILGGSMQYIANATGGTTLMQFQVKAYKITNGLLSGWGVPAIANPFIPILTTDSQMVIQFPSASDSLTINTYFNLWFQQLIVNSFADSTATSLLTDTIKNFLAQVPSTTSLTYAQQVGRMVSSLGPGFFGGSLTVENNFINDPSGNIFTHLRDAGNILPSLLNAGYIVVEAVGEVIA